MEVQARCQQSPRGLGLWEGPGIHQKAAWAVREGCREEGHRAWELESDKSEAPDTLEAEAIHPLGGGEA
jgi:hypothetical protein